MGHVDETLGLEDAGLPKVGFVERAFAEGEHVRVPEMIASYQAVKKRLPVIRKAAGNGSLSSGRSLATVCHKPK
jgi:hypothetical protein